VRDGQSEVPSPPTGARTVVGLWLRSLLGDDVELRRQLAGRLNGGKRGWNYDEAGVVEAAAELAAGQYFGTDYDVRGVSAAVSSMRAIRAARGHSSHGQLEMEAVIRRALGEVEVDVSGINPMEVFEIQGSVTVYAALKLGLTEAEFAELVAEAERTAFARLWRPPLAD
jgi:hypothetical protein